MEKKKKTGYKILLTSLTIAAILSNVSMQEVNAAEENRSNEVALKQEVTVFSLFIQLFVPFSSNDVNAVGNGELIRNESVFILVGRDNTLKELFRYGNFWCKLKGVQVKKTTNCKLDEFIEMRCKLEKNI